MGCSDSQLTKGAELKKGLEQSWVSGQDKEKNEGVGVVRVMLEEDPLQGCEIGRFHVAPSQRARGGEAEAVGDTPGPLILQELVSKSFHLSSASCQGHPVLPTALAHTICQSRERQGPCCCVPSGTGCESWTMGLSPWALGSCHEEPRPVV